MIMNILIEVFWMSSKKFNNKFNIVAKNILKYRLIRNLSQPDMYRKLALMGVTLYNNDIYKIEHYNRVVRDYELYFKCFIRSTI